MLGMGSHSVVTPFDLYLSAASSLAVAIAWMMDRRSGEGPRDAMNYVVVWVRYFFALHALWSGSNYFTGVMPQMQMEHPLAGPFQHYMTEMGLFAVVKAVETLVALCLIFNVFVPLALIMEVPISFNIFYLSNFVVADHRTVWTGPREIGMNLFLLAAYGGYFLPLFKARIPQKPLWKGLGRSPAPAAGETAPS
jgi:hypothetical protein